MASRSTREGPVAQFVAALSASIRATLTEHVQRAYLAALFCVRRMGLSGDCSGVILAVVAVSRAVNSILCAAHQGATKALAIVTSTN
jgi:hypothetical protein